MGSGTIETPSLNFQVETGNLEVPSLGYNIEAEVPNLETGAGFVEREIFRFGSSND